MSADDARDEIVALEATIEALSVRAEQCRKLALLARGATWVGVALLALLAIGAFGISPGVLIAGLIATLGGVALQGTNRSTLEEIEGTIADYEQRRTVLIDAVLADAS